MAFERTHYWTLKIQDGGDPHVENRQVVISLPWAVRIWIKFRKLVQNDMTNAVIWSKSKPEVEFQYGRRLG